VVVALSGGLDSAVLLHLLRFRVPDLDLRLFAAHFDHRMRASSHADADWVSGLCRAWQVPLERGATSVALRSEAQARAARYDFLRAAVRQQDAALLATGHHADDQAETVLFRIVRGTGIAGLRGIAEKRGALIRPLLPFHRAELAGYATACRLGWREDPTNRLLRYARNRIRHEILPRLEEIAPGAADALVGLAASAREIEEGWDWVLDRCETESIREQNASSIELARPVLLSYHPALRARLLRRGVGKLGGRLDRTGTGLALEFISSGASGTGIQIRGGLRLEREFDRIRIRRAGAGPGPAERPLIIPEAAAGAGAAVVGGRVFRLRWSYESGAETAETVDRRADASGASFDPTALRFPLVVRGWNAGDRIRLAAGTKKLKKLFGERRIGRSSRARIAVLADAEGRVLWAHGVARAAVAEPKPGGPVFRVMEANASAE
jgi:tRNA(Ile)-lysidine synthase